MKYNIKKGFALIVTLILVSVFTFIAFQIIPGDSAMMALGMNASQEEIQAYREELGLDKSLPMRYAAWITRAVQGDFGISVKYHMPVRRLISERLPVTVWLAFLSFLMIVVVSLPLGILASKQKDGPLDRLITILTQVSMSIPPFFLGILICLIFGIILKWFIPGQYVSYRESFPKFLQFMIFPAIAVAIPKIAMLVKYLRSSILRQSRLDYVRTARSKGMRERDVLYRHILRNAMIPVITFVAMIMADILAGAILIEQVFNLPGLGRLLLVAISTRDFSVVQAIILYMAAVVVILNFIVDIIYQWIDPRVSIGSK